MQWPDSHFFFLLTLSKAQKGGYIISNNRLCLEDWIQLGELREALERRKENQSLMNLANSMQVAMFKSSKR